MKHGMFQRSVSLLLALVMILGNVPMNALATETEETTTPVCEHSYEAVTTDATCTADGVVVYTCGCGNTYSETIAATGHTWGEWAIVEEASYEAAGSQTRTCACGASETAQIPQLVHEHSFGEWSVITEATYEAPGSQSRTCACGASETAQIPQLVHEHSFGDWSVVTEATYEAPGAQVRTCECGASETEAIPQLIKEKAELSGEKRKIYFLNTENWEEVYIAWSFDEEDFQDVAFPGEEMEEDEDLENVYVVELPVEADAVTFNDGVEVTQELLAKEAEAGLEINHAFEAELDEELDYFSAEEQVEDEEDATEWLAYEDVLEAYLEAREAAAQAIIDRLPAAVTSQEEYDAVYAIVDELAEGGYELTAAQEARALEAIDAADLWYTGETAGTYEETDDWYWEDNTLYIKDGKITKGQLYKALARKYDATEKNEFKYAASEPWSWDNKGEKINSVSTGDAGLTQATWYARNQGYTTIFGKKVWSYGSGDTFTFTVKFYGNKLVAKDSVDTVAFNTKKSVADQLDALKQAIFAAVVDTGATMPEGIKYTDLNYQYYPWYKDGIGTWGYSGIGWDSVLTDLTGTPASHTTYTGYTFGAPFAAGNKTTEKVRLTGTGAWAGLFVEAEITLMDNRPAVTIVYSGEASHTCNTYADFVAYVKSKITATYEGDDAQYTVSQSEDAGEKTYTYTVNVEDNATHKGATKDITVTWVKSTYDITFDYDGTHGELTKTVKLPYGTTAAEVEAQAPAHKDVDGYAPNGWAPAFAYVTGAATYVAQYSQQRIYTVKFMVDGVQLGETQLVNVEKNEKVSFPADPDKANAIFDGWSNADKIVDGIPTGDALTIELVAQWNTNDANDNNVDDSAETVSFTMTTAGAGTVSLAAAQGATLTDNGNTYTLLFNSENAATKVITVTVTPNDNSASNKANYLQSITFNGTAIEGNTFTAEAGTLAVTFAEETFSLANSDRMIEVNGFNNETVAQGLKKLVLDEVIGGNYNANDYKVEMLTEYKIGDTGLGEAYYDVTGVKIEIPNLLQWLFGKTVELPADWFVSQFVTDGETQNNFKVTKLAASNTSRVDLYHEQVMIKAKESRTAAEIQLSPNAFAADTFADIEAQIKAAVQYKKDGAWVDITDSHVAVSAINAEGSQTVTITVTSESADYLKNETGINPVISVTLKDYTVTWNPNGGNWNGATANDVDTYHQGETIAKPADPTKTGYTFDGWGNVAATMGNQPLEYTAQWNINTHNVIWNVDGTKTEVPYEYGATIKAPEDPTKVGHTFAGWSEYPATMPDEDVEVTASFNINSYNVIWKWQNAEGEQTTTVTLPYGTAITVPDEIPTQYKVGNVTYNRIGWFDVNGNELKTATVPVGGITYTADYTTATTWYVKFDTKGADPINDATVVVEEGETAVVAKPTDPTREGYRFDGWYLGETEYDFATPVTENITLTAKWVKQVTVSFDVEGIDAQTFDINGVATKPEDPTKDQTIFGGWYLGETEYDFATPVTENITLTANWIDDTNKNGVADAEETITVTVVGSGTVEVTGATELALGTVDTTNYLYDSTKPEVIKITATPVVAEGVSQSCVKSILVGDQAAELTYGENFVATVELTAKGGDAITVTFEDTAFTYDEDGMLFFYSGIETPDPEKLYNAVITAPAYDKDKVTTIEYLARYQGEFTFTIPELFRLEIPIPGLSDIIIGNYDYTVDLNEEWLYVGEEFKTVKSEDVTLMIEEKFAELKAKFEQIDLSAFEGIDWSDWKDPAGKISELTAAYNDIKGQVENLTAELEALIAEVTEQAKWIGYHQFGAMNDATIYDENNNVVETMRVVYKDNGKYLQDDNIKIHLYDDRETVSFANGNVSFEYDEYTNADLLAAVNLVDSKGNVVTVSGDKAPYMKLDLSGKDVGEYTYTVYFDGNNEYKPAADATFTLTVIKAPSSTDIVDVNITFGESYDGAPVITNKHGVQIDADVIEFILGLDVANLDLNENKNGIVGVNTVIQLMMPEELEGILGLLGLEEGATISLSDLIDLLGGADSLLGDLGLSGDATAPVEEALDYLVNIFDSYDLQIMLGGERPTNVGAYLHGAVALDSNYETSYDIGYILIAPKTTEHTLEWNTAALNNAVVTLPAFRNMDLGATAAGAKDMEVSYLFLGINNETGDIYSVDIYGDIKLNVWAYPENIKDNGAYVQMAYGIEWGNEFEYAIPIIRSFVIVPDVTKLDIIVDGQPSADLYKTVFDNAPVDVTVNGQIPEGGQVKLHYYGIEANTETYDSDIAPSHTGAYAITATLVTRDANGEMTSVGLDVATVVIQPTESAVTMKELETVTYDGQGHKVSEVMEIVASSTVENLKPDTTVITASIATDGSFSENGWAAAQGTVNVDFPRWMDELIAKYAPSVKDGITLSELEAKLLNKLPTITDKLEELGATNEMVNSTKNLLTNVSSLLEELPADAVLSFKDDYEVLAVGTYAVAAVVTDSDHIPSVDAGLLVIVPDADQVFLDWDYHDENNIWSRELLSNVSINATAFNDKAFTEPNAQATAKITYQFIGLDQDAGLKIYTDPAQLPNGIYTQIAYIELEVDSQIVLSDIITRTIVIVPNMPELQIVDSRGAAQDKFEFTFDNEPVELYVKQNGQTIENQIRYIGLQTNGVEYDSTVAPVHAGAYAAITVLKTQENVGMDVALVTIAPAKSDISVTGGTVAYNGKKQTATVKAESPNSTVTSPDYTLISGTVDISAGVQNVGLESLCGDVNIDLPNWLDDVLAKTDFNRVDADVASVATFISEYRNDLLKLIPDQMLESAGLSTETVEAIMQKLNGGIDELLKVLDKLPDNVHLTFESNKGYTELGSYFYYGIVTDSDHIPAADTGLLVIVPATITADDVEVTSQHVYNGKEQTVTVEIKVGDKILEAGRDYEVTGNTATNAGEYVMTVIGKGNYAGELSVEWSIEKAPVEVTLSDMTKTYGDGDPTLTYTVKGLTDGDSAANLNIAATRKPGENVGTYVITATAENANYNITIINGTFTITKANAMVADAPAVKELTYTGEDQLLVDAGRSNDGKLMYSLDQNGEYTENIPTGKDANEYTVWYYVAGDANHEDSAKQSVKVIIKSKSITDVAVSLDGKPTFNGTAYVQNVIVKDGEYVLNLNDYEIIGNTATGAGKYTLTVKGKGNYAGEVKIEWSFGDGYPIYFQSGDANGMIHAETTVFVDDVAYVLDENCVAWAADKNRELAIGYVYKNSGNHITDYAHSDTTKNMYIWDLQWNEETKSYKADRVEELDNLLSFAGGSIWLGSDGVNGIRTYYSTTADTEAVKGAFRNLGYEVVTHGIVVGWADKLNGSEPVPNGNNSASGHAVGNGTFYDEIYPAADKYITPDLRARFYVELKNIETSESKIIYSGSVERSIGYIAYQNIGRVDAQYQPYVKAILDKAAAAGYTYGNY